MQTLLKHIQSIHPISKEAEKSCPVGAISVAVQ